MNKLPDYDNDPSNYYEVLKTLSPSDLTQVWQEIDIERYWWLMECVPPRAMKDNGFLVGECMTHTEHGAIYEAVIQVDERYFSRPAYWQSFNVQKYSAEIRAQFNIRKDSNQ